MPTLLLTDSFLKGLTTPSEAIEYRDTKVTGLSVRHAPSDKLVWTVRYSLRGSTRQRRYPLGDYPDLSLAKAREHAKTIRNEAKTGADPAKPRDAARAENKRADLAAGYFFDMLCEDYYEVLPTLKSSWEQDKRYIEKDIRPTWAKKSVDKIGSEEVTALLADIAERAPVVANRVRAAGMALFKWAIANDAVPVSASPFVGVGKPTDEGKDEVDRHLDDAELVVLWRAIEAAKLAPGVTAALKVLALTGQRPNEICGLSLAELRFIDDSAHAVADLPAQRMKGRRRHVTPLSEPVCRIIRAEIERHALEARIERSNPVPFVFTSRFMARDHVARHSLSQALRRVIPAMTAEGDDAAVIKRLKDDPPTPHAFRRTCATGMARLKIVREDRMAVMAHKDDTVHSKHYDAYDRLDEKREALNKWAQHIEDLLAGRKQTGEVVPIRKAMA